MRNILRSVAVIFFLVGIWCWGVNWQRAKDERTTANNGSFLGAAVSDAQKSNPFDPVMGLDDSVFIAKRVFQSDDKDKPLRVLDLAEIDADQRHYVSHSRITFDKYPTEEVAWWAIREGDCFKVRDGHPILVSIHRRGGKVYLKRKAIQVDPATNNGYLSAFTD